MARSLSVVNAGGQLLFLIGVIMFGVSSILGGLNLARYFADEAIVGGDGPFPRKPDPSGLRHLLARVAVAPAEALLVGDSTVDWRTAQNASTAICLARYGFGFEGVPVGELRPGDRVIDAPIDLLAAVQA